jgi:hypothetical protein
LYPRTNNFAEAYLTAQIEGRRMIKACAGYLPGYSLKTNWTFMNTHKPTPLFWNIVRGFSGMIFALLTLYLVNDLIDGSIEYGICGGPHE